MHAMRLRFSLRCSQAFTVQAALFMLGCIYISPYAGVVMLLYPGVSHLCFHFVGMYTEGVVAFELLQCSKHFSCIECIDTLPRGLVVGWSIVHCGVSHVCFHSEFRGHVRRGRGYSQTFTVQAALLMHLMHLYFTWR